MPKPKCCFTFTHVCTYFTCFSMFLWLKRCQVFFFLPPWGIELPTQHLCFCISITLPSPTHDLCLLQHWYLLANRLAPSGAPQLWPLTSTEVNTMTGVWLTSHIVLRGCLPVTVREENREDSLLFSVRSCQYGLMIFICLSSSVSLLCLNLYPLTDLKLL